MDTGGYIMMAGFSILVSYHYYEYNYDFIYIIGPYVKPKYNDDIDSVYLHNKNLKRGDMMPRLLMTILNNYCNIHLKIGFTVLA